MWRGNAFLHYFVGLSVCLQCSNFWKPSESSCFGMHMQPRLQIIFRSISYIKIIGQGQSHRSKESVKFYLATHSVTDTAQSRCNCSDDKSIHSGYAGTRGMAAPASGMCNIRSADRPWQSAYVCVFCSWVVCLRLKGNLVLFWLEVQWKRLQDSSISCESFFCGLMTVWHRSNIPVIGPSIIVTKR